MGLFTTLVTLPLAPVRGAAWIAQQVADEAERQQYDEGQIRRELLQLELDHDAGLVGDEEYAARADTLIEAREYARQMRDARGHVPETEVWDG